MHPQIFMKTTVLCFSYIKLITYVTFQAKNDLISVSVIDVIALKPYAYNTINTHIRKWGTIEHKKAQRYHYQRRTSLNSQSASQSVNWLVYLSVSPSVSPSIRRSASQ